MYLARLIKILLQQPTREKIRCNLHAPAPPCRPTRMEATYPKKSITRPGVVRLDPPTIQACANSSGYCKNRQLKNSPHNRVMDFLDTWLSSKWACMKAAVQEDCTHFFSLWRH